MKKKSVSAWIGIIALLMICIIPYACAEESGIYIAGQKMPENKVSYWKNNSTETGVVEGTKSNYNVKFVPASKKSPAEMYFRDVKIINDEYDHVIDIHESLNLILEEGSVNTVIANYAAQAGNECVAINADRGTFTISGTGKLIAKANTKAFRRAICTLGAPFVIESGTIEALSSAGAPVSSGIVASGIKIKGGHVTAIGGDATDSIIYHPYVACSGIGAGSGAIVSGGTVIAQAGSATGHSSATSCGFYANDGIVFSGGTATMISGTVTGNSKSYSCAIEGSLNEWMEVPQLNYLGYRWKTNIDGADPGQYYEGTEQKYVFSRQHKYVSFAESDKEYEKEEDGGVINDKEDLPQKPVEIPVIILGSEYDESFTVNLKVQNKIQNKKNTITFNVKLCDKDGNEVALPDECELLFPYPEGMNEESANKWHFVIHHYGSNKTEVFHSEKGTVKVTPQGLRIKVSSLSPFELSWHERVYSDLPSTGDDSNIYVYFVMLLISIGALFAAAKVQRKRN